MVALNIHIYSGIKFILISSFRLFQSIWLIIDIKSIGSSDNKMCLSVSIKLNWHKINIYLYMLFVIFHTTRFTYIY